MSMIVEHDRRIARVHAHIEANLDRDLDVGALARVAGLSPFHFHRVFRALVGEPVMAYVRRLRLERAARQLVTSERRVLDVALEAGFESHEAFTRAFVGHFGVAPKDYRREAGSAVALWRRDETVPASLARLEDRPALRVLAVRHVGPYTSVGDAWRLLVEATSARGVFGDMVGLSWDDPEVTEPARFRYDACVVTEAAEVAPLRAHVVAAGRFVVAVHVGAYSTLSDTYARMTRWSLERELPLGADPSVERYLDLPGSVPESQLRTELAMRLA